MDKLTAIGRDLLSHSGSRRAAPRRTVAAQPT